MLRLILRKPKEEPKPKRDLLWGTYGEGGIEHCAGTCPLHRLRWKRLDDCDTKHLQMILLNQRHVHGTYYEFAIRSILIGRGVKPKEFSLEAENELFDAVSRAVRYKETETD